MPPEADGVPAALLKMLRDGAQAKDQSGDWPGEELSALAEIGAMRWAVPEEFGGLGLDTLALHERYEVIASASLASALVLTQRDAAVGIIADSDNEKIRKELLPRLAHNEDFATVGIAQLTTSRQGGRPVLAAESRGQGWRLHGLAPWATGAAKAS